MTGFRLFGTLALVLAPPALAAPDCGADAGPCMDHSAASERRAVAGPPDRFTGSVTVRPVFEARPPGRTSAGEVTFAPGARSAWHRHPLGQHLIVTDGLGWTQVEGGPIVEMRPGDVIWCPPGVKHWHGPRRSRTSRCRKHWTAPMSNGSKRSATRNIARVGDGLHRMLRSIAWRA